MNALFEAILKAIDWLSIWPGHSERIDRSVVGESQLDRSARRMWWFVSLLILGAIVVAALLADS